MMDRTQTVAQIVLEHSECAKVFQELRIDFCCRGNVSLAAACAEKDLDAAGVAAELERAIAARRGHVPKSPRSMPTPDLVDYIVSIHHTYVREAFAFIVPLAAKVARVHGDKSPSLVVLEKTVIELRNTLEPHLDEEERVLFPTLASEHPSRAFVEVDFATTMEEHRHVGRLLARMRADGEDYSPPDWACASYRTLLEELSALEIDTQRHIHLENNVLMPRFST